MRWHRWAVYTLLAGAATAAAQPTPTTSPAPIDTRSPKGALKSLAVAMERGDAAGIRSLIYAATPAEQTVLAATSTMAGAIAGLNHAMVDRFGKSSVTPVLGDPAEQLQQSLKNIDASVEKVDGDHAAVSVAPGMAQDSMSLHEVDGVWKVQLPEQAKSLTDQQAQENAGMLQMHVTAIESVTAEVQSGKYATASAAAAALRAKVAEAQTPPITLPASQPTR